MKHTMKSIVISLAAMATTLPTDACIWQNTHNYYLFSIHQGEGFSARAAKECENYWKAYLHKPSSEFYYFEADEVIKEAQRRGDKQTADYVEHLRLYLDCSNDVETEKWEYPTKEQLEQRRQTLLRVKAYAQNHLDSPLASQQALLLMRCQMLLGQHRENIGFWEQTASKGKDCIYKEMMLGIYAGALFHNGRSDEAGQIFAKIGDWRSLMTQYYKKRSYNAIAQEYQRDPDSDVLPFLLQDFVNNAQEATDNYDEGMGVLQGKLFVRNIQKAEAMQMCKLAKQIVEQGRTRQPAMWQSARAWLLFLFGNKQQALADIKLATDMKGSTRVKDCARVLRLYITAACNTKTTRAFDNYIAAGLRWLDAMAFSDYQYSLVKDRLVHQTLTTAYTNSGRSATALALLKAAEAYCYYDYLDTMSIGNFQKYIDYATHPATSPLDKYLTKNLRLDHNATNDLMGTKYLRQCRWEEAQKWLSQVPASYYAEKGYAVYAAHRKTTVEPWMKRQWISNELAYNPQPVKLKDNPKLLFAREMQTLEDGMAALSDKQRQQRCYDLAVRYAQVSITGDCWFIMRDGKSIVDTVRTGEADFQAKARELLRKTAQTSDPKLREKALFALSYSGLYSESQAWYTLKWDANIFNFTRVPQPGTQQYKAFSDMVRYEQNADAAQADYVTKCDEYKKFKTVYSARNQQ